MEWGKLRCSVLYPEAKEPAYLEIRRAEPSDAAAISDLLRELGYESPAAETAERIISLADSQWDAAFVPF